MNSKYVVYIDQYGNKFYVKSVRELRSQIKNGNSTVHKMYEDNIDNSKTYHTGYIIGGHWLKAYQPIRIEQ